MQLKTGMPLVVLTYPGHFLLTILTIKSYLKYHIPTEIIVVVDDISNQAWPSYLTDCQEFYNNFELTVTIRPSSSILPIIQKFNSGWIRQQLIKLHLDLIIEPTHWFFTDGDIIFLHSVDPNKLPYSLPLPVEGQNNYIRAVLGIEQAGIFVNGIQVCVNDPAFRAMDKQTLIDLRNHVEQVHQKSISEIHFNYRKTSSIVVTEWELLESFKLYVQGHTPNLVRYAPHDLMNPPDNLNFFTHQFLTCYNTDQDFSRTWFSDQGITVLDNLWEILSNIKR
jgi:hypothetical protein